MKIKLMELQSSPCHFNVLKIVAKNITLVSYLNEFDLLKLS